MINTKLKEAKFNIEFRPTQKILRLEFSTEAEEKELKTDMRHEEWSHYE